MSERERFQKYVESKKPSTQGLILAQVNNIFLTLTGGGLAAHYDMLGEKMLPWYIVTAIFYIGGRIVDSYSTTETIKIINRAETNGIKSFLVETNPHLSARPREEDQFRPRYIAMEATGVVPALTFPITGFVAGVASYVFAINNHILGREIKKQIERN